MYGAYTDHLAGDQHGKNVKCMGLRSHDDTTMTKYFTIICNLCAFINAFFSSPTIARTEGSPLELVLGVILYLSCNINLSFSNDAFSQVMLSHT